MTDKQQLPEPIPIDRDRLRGQLQAEPEKLRDVLMRLVEQARMELPDDYDVEAAFADVLSLGALEAHPDAQRPLLRIAVFLFDRLPKGGE